MIDPIDLESRIRNPYRPALITVGGLLGLFAVPALAAIIVIIRGTIAQPAAPFLFVGTGLFLFFGLTWAITWIAGQVKARRMTSFLRSPRVLVGWRYTGEEWEQIKEARWQEEHTDWKTQLGCMTGLLGLAGLLAGLLIGAEEGLAEAIVGGLVWGAVGSICGGLLGAAIAGGNHLAARRAYRDPIPGLVALAPHEILANDDYFRDDGVNRYIKEAHLEPGDPAQLLIQVWSPKFRGSAEEEWTIAVPPRMRQAIEATLPLIAAPNPSPDQGEL